MKLLKLFKYSSLSTAFSLSAFSVAMLFTGSSSLLGLINPSKASAQETARKPFGFVLKSAIWKTNPIPVCWENPSNNFSTEMSWVQNAVANSWETVPGANVRFANWNQCSSNSSGIRIQIDDQGPHTKGLGSTLNRVRNGMVLNFTFQNWSQNCQATRQRCIELIAIHEFGHALGFAHEQNRPDTPATQPGITQQFCTQERQGSLGNLTIGAWDLNSVMNYCNPNWTGNGVLSATDIQTVQAVYSPMTAQIASVFGYIKNSRLVATGRPPESMNGHINWALNTGQSYSTVKTEILSDLNQARSLITQSPSMQSCQAFGYMKNGMLTLLRGTTEPHIQHVNWCKIELERGNWGQVVSAMNQEFVSPIQNALR